MHGVEDDISTSHLPKKIKTQRQLFRDTGEQCSLKLSQEIVAVPQLSKSRKLHVSKIGLTKDKFCIEGKVLNKYATYDSTKDYRKYLKMDLTDEIGFSIVTLIFGPTYYKAYVDKISEGLCFHIEGANVVARNPNDGGSIDYSLVVDATTAITPIPRFETELFFVPELTIRSFPKKVAANPSLRTKIAFVIMQVDNIQKIEGGVFEQLTIADGSAPLDRATLTFVNKRKSLYYQMVDNFNQGNIIPFLARNIGAWKERSNTLSILDITLIAPLHGDKRKRELEVAFHSQIKSLGYGKEVSGTLRILNFNDTLIVRKCASCKGSNIDLLSEGAFCFSCGAKLAIAETIKLVGEIDQGDKTTEVIIAGETVDKLLQFDSPLLDMCKTKQGLTKILLSEVQVKVVFLLDPHGQIISFS